MKSQEPKKLMKSQESQESQESEKPASGVNAGTRTPGRSVPRQRVDMSRGRER